MGKFISRFDTTAELATASAKTDGSFIMPHVSLTKDNESLHYLSEGMGHEFVNLGLPSGTKWATMNVGALSESDYGDAYAYGKGASRFEDESYSQWQAQYTGNENPLAASADTASVVWGGSWHTPTKTQFEELTANTTFEWTTINGINGAKYTGTNGKYIFLPAAGIWYYIMNMQTYVAERVRMHVGDWAEYWTSTPSSGSSDAYLFGAGATGYIGQNVNARTTCMYIRPVIG